MDVIKKTFKKALIEFGIGRMIEVADRVIVGFSGGADSRVLLLLLKEYSREHNTEIVCAHVNHMIRGKDADEDEMKCVAWASESGVPIIVKKVDVPSISRREGKGIEETARDERYKFFEELESSYEGKTLIATAHNADDNLETVVFNLLRGSGTHGMAGIPPVRDGKYIRPLILCSSSSIRDYCRENKIPYNIDETNVNTDYSRNYIRNKIVPLFSEITENPQDAALRMCSILRSDDEFVSSCADTYINENGSGTQSVDALSALHDAVLSRVIERLYKAAGGKRALSKIHVDSVIDAVKNKKGAVSLNLPDGVVYMSSSGKASFEKNGTEIKRIEGFIPLEANGEPFVFGDYAVVASVAPEKTIIIKENIYNLSINQLTNFDKIKKDFYVRRRVDGDTYKFGGMTRKVKKLFSEKKIPVNERESGPVVCDRDGIVWIPGFPLRDGASGNSEYKNVNISLCLYERNV